MKKLIGLLFVILAVTIGGNANAAAVVGYVPQASYPVIMQQPQCRQMRQDVWVGSHIRSTYYNVCLQPDGSWAAINPYGYYPGTTVAYVQPEPVIAGEVIIGVPGWYHGRYWTGHHWR